MGAVHCDACQNGLQTKDLPQMLRISHILQSNASIVSHSLFTAVLSMICCRQSASKHLSESCMSKSR